MAVVEREVVALVEARRVVVLDEAPDVSLEHDARNAATGAIPAPNIDHRIRSRRLMGSGTARKSFTP